MNSLISALFIVVFSVLIRAILIEIYKKGKIIKKIHSIKKFNKRKKSN